MIRTLFRQDPALRTLRASIPISLFTGIFLSAAVCDRVGWLGPGTLDGQVQQVTLLLLIVWAELFLFAIFAHIPARASQLSLALPVETHRLWLVRLAAILSAGLIPLAIITVLITLHSPIFGGGGGGDPRLLLLGIRIGGGFILTILLFQLPSPDLYRIRTRRGYLTFTVLVWTAMGALLILLPHSTIFSVAPGLVAALPAAWIFRKLPAGFLVVSFPPGRRGEPAETGHGEFTDATAADLTDADPGPADAVRRSPHPVYWTVGRLLVNHPLTWFALPFLMYWGDRLVFAYRGGWDLIPYFILLLIYPAFLIFFAALRLFQIDPLPISRQSVFPYIYLPAVFAFVVGLGVGGIDYSFRQSREGMIHHRGHGIQVPEDSWEITTDGRAPLVVAPWGETYRPKAYPLYRGSRFAVYNPYERGESSSTRFINFQLSRAVEVIHGRAFSSSGAPGDANDSPAGLDDDDRCCLPLEGTAGAGSAGRHRTIATTAMLLILLSNGLYSLGLQQFRARPLRYLFPWFLQGLVGPLALLAFLVLVGNATGLTSFEAVATFPMVMIRKLGETIPGPTMVIWLLAGLAFVLGYLVLQSRFSRIEAPLGQLERNLAKEF